MYINTFIIKFSHLYILIFRLKSDLFKGKFQDQVIKYPRHLEA